MQCDTRNAARIFGGCLDRVKVVSISPQTSAAATEAGLTVHAEAKKYNMDGLIEAVIQHRKDNS